MEDESGLSDEIAAEADLGLSPVAAFLVRADRVADRLDTLLREVDCDYQKLRAGGWELPDFLSHTEPRARRVLDLDRRLPIPPTECLGEEAALLLALQAAANAVLQVTPGDAGLDTADQPTTLHHASFQRSLEKSRQHLDDYRTHRGTTNPRL